MLPNGGFPPLKICETEETKKSNKEKGFFASTNTNTINIRDILKKNKIKVTETKNKEEEIDIVDSL